MADLRDTRVDQFWLEAFDYGNMVELSIMRQEDDGSRWMYKLQGEWVKVAEADRVIIRMEDHYSLRMHEHQAIRLADAFANAYFGDKVSKLLNKLLYFFDKRSSDNLVGLLRDAFNTSSTDRK